MVAMQGVAMPEALISATKTSDALTLSWLALALTPGLGPTRARRLVDLLGSVDVVFRASLTEVEAAGIQSVSAQSLGMGVPWNWRRRNSDVRPRLA
jgi:hypothetical protein